MFTLGFEELQEVPPDVGLTVYNSRIETVGHRRRGSNGKSPGPLRNVDFHPYDSPRAIGGSRNAGIPDTGLAIAMHNDSPFLYV